MTSRSAILASAWVFALAFVPAMAAEPAFVKKPTASRVKDKVRIDFEVNQLCDVAVYVEDGQGKVVRHLAAGVLGKNPPAPLKPDSLAQSIEWDGRDDDDRPAAGGALKIRVALGLRASYAGQPFAAKGQTGPNHLEGVMGLTVAPDGRVYVLDRCNGQVWGGSRVLVFRRDGLYEKTIKPFPANTPIEKARAADAVINAFGGFNPVKHLCNALTSFYPAEDVSHQPAATADGRLVLAVAPGNLALLDRDGGIPEAAYAGPALGAGVGFKGYPVLAVAPDAKSVYLIGLGTGRKIAPAVYRTRLPDRGPAEDWFGDPATPGNDQAHLDDPRGVAVDGKGHVLVADFGNNRVLAINEADRRVAGSFVVQAPNWLGVHRRTGAVYVQSGETLIKFSGWENATEQARVELPKVEWGGKQSWKLALDAAAEPATVWGAAGVRLVRFEDRGASFADPAPADCHPAWTFYRPAADPTRREVLCKTYDAPWTARIRILDETTGEVRIVPGSTGKGGLAGIEGRQHRLGPDGCIYAQDHAMFGVIRYDRNGKFKPFEATANDPYLKGRLPVGNTGTTNWERDFSVDRKGDIYVKAVGAEYHGLMSVHVYGQDGRFKRFALQVVSDGAYGPRVDPQGNLYIMDSVKAPGQPFPDEFKAPAAASAATQKAIDWIYGSVIKFGPEGGAVWFTGSQPLPLTYEGWGQQHARPGGSGTWNAIPDLRTTGGALTGTITMKPAFVTFPYMCLDAAANTRINLRLKNGTDGTQATLEYLNSFSYGAPTFRKTIEIKPQSDFTEYTFDLSGEKEWKGIVKSLRLMPSNAGKGSFAIDWVRIGEAGANLAWNFDAEDSREKKLPATMKKEKVGALGRPDGAELQGAQWYSPGFSPLGDMVSWTCGSCHCTGADFDVDDFGRTFAPDAGRFRVGVLDANGNAILSFGAYGNQDNCGPDSYVVDPVAKVLRARQDGDPKDLVSPFATPEIAFAWIVGVAVTDRHAYVDDMINKRIIRVKLAYAAEERCEVN
jgi:hypothetical protein